MSAKRKRETEDEALLSPPAKQIREEEVTRSGRVRKKPSKFIEDKTGGENKTRAQVDLGLLPLPVQEIQIDIKEPLEEEDIVTPVKTDMSLSADEDFGKSGGGRSGRARKKSAKVLEMEEFEEAERKSLKKEVGKKSITPIQNLPKKNQKSPTSPVLAITSTLSTTKLNISNLPMPTNPVQTQISPPKKNTSPKSPIAIPTQSVQGESKASVIKLLLSSPTQSSSSIIPSTPVTQVSSPASDKPATSTKKKAKSKEKTVQQLTVTSPVDSNSQLKQVLHIPKQPFIIRTKPETQDDGPNISVPTVSGTTVGSLLKIDKKEATPKVEKIKMTKEPKAKKEKKSPKELPIPTIPTIPSPNVIHVGSMSLAGIETKHELEIVSGRKRKPSKAKLEQEEEAMISDEYELDVPDISLSEPGEDSFMKMEDDSLEIPTEEFEVKPKPAKKKKMVKEKGEKHSVTDTLAEMPSSELVMDFSRMKYAEKKKKKQVKEVAKDLDKSKKKRAPTAYTLWCNVNRPKVVAENPGIDFSSVSKTLGEMWSSLPEKEKMVWKRKAKKATGKGSTLITTGKTAVPKAPAPQVAPVSKPSKETVQKAVVQSALVAMKQQKNILDDINVPLKGFGKEPVDVAAHLKIVGESLSIIGMKLQEHRGLIAVQGSLSVLLDSMLCAVAPLMCLTSLLPETDGLPERVHLKNLDNIAYIMPGL